MRYQFFSFLLLTYPMLHLVSSFLVCNWSSTYYPANFIWCKLYVNRLHYGETGKSSTRTIAFIKANCSDYYEIFISNTCKRLSIISYRHQGQLSSPLCYRIYRFWCQFTIYRTSSLFKHTDVGFPLIERCTYCIWHSDI